MTVPGLEQCRYFVPDPMPLAVDEPISTNCFSCTSAPSSVEEAVSSYNKYSTEKITSSEFSDIFRPDHKILCVGRVMGQTKQVADVIVNDLRLAAGASGCVIRGLNREPFTFCGVHIGGDYVDEKGHFLPHNCALSVNNHGRSNQLIEY